MYVIQNPLSFMLTCTVVFFSTQTTKRCVTLKQFDGILVLQLKTSNMLKNRKIKQQSKGQCH